MLWRRWTRRKGVQDDPRGVRQALQGRCLEPKGALDGDLAKREREREKIRQEE